MKPCETKVEEQMEINQAEIRNYPFKYKKKIAEDNVSFNYLNKMLQHRGLASFSTWWIFKSDVCFQKNAVLFWPYM